jgi:hypothetical protein
MSDIADIDMSMPTYGEKPFEVPCHLVRVLGIDPITAMSDINIHCAVF